jgi:hypothetical protein
LSSSTTKSQPENGLEGKTLKVVVHRLCAALCIVLVIQSQSRYQKCGTVSVWYVTVPCRILSLAGILFQQLYKFLCEGPVIEYPH